MDEADITQARLEREAELREKARGGLTYEIPAGKAGDCDLCGEWCGRLVGGVCAPRRDKHGLP